MNNFHYFPKKLSNLTVIGNDATFVRYMNGPTSDAQASIAVIESLVSMMANQPEINEFKHTRAPM